MSVATLVIMCWAGLQWYEMRETGKQTGELLTAAKTQADAAREMVIASKRNAAASEQFSTSADKINVGVAGAVSQLKAAASNAKLGIEATQDALRIDQRAWVGIVSIDSNPEVEAGKQFLSAFTFKNTGKTPAMNLTVRWASVGLLGGSEPDPSLLSESPSSQGVLEPNAAGQIVSDKQEVHSRRLAQAEADDIESRRLTMYVYGEIS